MIKKIVKAARSLFTRDTGNYRRVGISYEGVSKQALDFTPYGFFHNTPSGGLALVFAQNGQESNSFAIVDDPINRFKNTNSGECGLYNQITENYVYLKSDGTIEMKTGATTAILSDGTLTVDGGDVVINGDLIVNGEITQNLGGDTRNMSAHVHTGVDAGPDNSGPPV